MRIPGMTDALEDPRLRAKAEEESQRLLEELKKEVQAEITEMAPLRKALRITVPAKVIADHLDHNYREIMHDVVVPGFRKGRTPRRLVEKRFGAEVRESLTTSIVGQSFFAVVENHKLDVLGDPLFQVSQEQGVRLVGFDEALQHLKLPPTGDFSYTCEVEVRPEFTLPELTGIAVSTPQIDLTDEMVEAEVLRLRKLRGRWEPLTEGAAERDDLLVADVTLLVEGNVVQKEENAHVGVRPAAVAGVALPTLDEILRGARPGETRTADCVIPDDFERADLRGKPGRFEFKVHELKRLVPQTVPDFLASAGFEDEAEARNYLRLRMEQERDELVARAKREQIHEYLLKNAPFELPEKITARQTARAVLRRVVELRQRGVPEADIAANIDELRTRTSADVARGLKLGFILDKVAEQLNIDVTDEEVNTEIARIAQRYGRRFDRVRDELQKDDLLTQLADQIRHDKCLDHLLSTAKPAGSPAANAAAPADTADKQD